ncbi:MAG: hypothetical protein H6Q73_219 [Firmicutes bacterium]|nr:hypothetical protein [Bacillota bacterium]
MEKIRELLNEAAQVCEESGIPFLAAYGIDKISVVEFTPPGTPERLKKTKVTLMMGAKQVRRNVEIQD